MLGHCCDIVVVINIQLHTIAVWHVGTFLAVVMFIRDFFVNLTRPTKFVIGIASTITVLVVHVVRAVVTSTE